jgi:hypothetical protein
VALSDTLLAAASVATRRAMASCTSSWNFSARSASVRCQGTNGPGLIGPLGRPIRVTFSDKIKSLFRGQEILSL